MSPHGCETRNQILRNIQETGTDFRPDHEVRVMTYPGSEPVVRDNLVFVSVCDVVALDVYVDDEQWGWRQQEFYNTIDRVSFRALEPFPEQHLVFWDRVSSAKQFQRVYIIRKFYLVHSSEPISFELGFHNWSRMGVPNTILARIELQPNASGP